MRQLITPDDLDEEAATDIVRLAVRLHDGAPATAAVRLHGVVAVVLAGSVATATKLRLQAAIERLGAAPVRCRVTPDGLAPHGGGIDHGVDLRSPRAVVVSGIGAAAVAAVAEQTGIPTINAGTDEGDPWPLLAEQVAQELAAAVRSRRAVAGIAEMRREAMVPTAVAIIATIATALPRPSVDEPAHWFG